MGEVRATEVEQLLGERGPGLGHLHGLDHGLHLLPELLVGYADHGDVGPPLDDIGSRMKAAEIRARVVNPKGSNPDTIMPAFYKKEGFHRLQKKWAGKTIISAQDVEDIVAYMLTLKGSYSK